jgi:hypothetical protein
VKILTVAEFDPAGYHLRHREALRRQGVDYRLAVHAVYRPEGKAADWILGEKGREGALRAFAEQADVVQFCPSIGQPWSFSGTDPRFDDADFVPYGSIDWPTLNLRRRVALFHGSLNAAANAERYAAHYKEHGFTVAATTIDYAHRMGATYLPAIVDLRGHERAGLRMDREPLRIVHTPTDFRACSSHEFVEVAASAGLNVTVVHNSQHGVVLAAKVRAHAGFDHLRGCFSINSLENAALGLVNVVGVKDEYRHVLGDVTLPWPTVRTMGDVRDTLLDLREDAALCRHWQEKARTWAQTEWHPDVVAKRVIAAYEALA